VGNDEVAHNFAVLDLLEGRLDAAIAQLDRLAARVPEALINLGIAYFTRASHPRASEPDGDLAQARLALDEALVLNPQQVVPYFYGGQLHELRARLSADGWPLPTPAPVLPRFWAIQAFICLNSFLQAAHDVTA